MHQSVEKLDSCRRARLCVWPPAAWGTSAPACVLLMPSPWFLTPSPSPCASSLDIPSITQNPAIGCS